MVSPSEQRSPEGGELEGYLSELLALTQNSGYHCTG
jgi:hypothetical protein